MKKKTRYGKRSLSFALCLAMAVSLIPAASAEKLRDKYSALFNGESVVYESMPTYSTVLSGWRGEGFKDAGTDIDIDIWNYAYDGEPPVKDIKENQECLVYGEETASIRWNAVVEEAGLYELEIVYFIEGEQEAPVKRSVLIDGKPLFNESENLVLAQRFANGEPVLNKKGEQMVSPSVKLTGWYEQRLRDMDGKHSQPLLWALSAGSHTIELAFVEQPVCIKAVRLRAREELPSYAQVKEEYVREGYAEASKPITFQAEDGSVLAYKSESTISAYSNKDPKTKPNSVLSNTLNSMGGNSWKAGNQLLVYKLDVPADGLYKLTMQVQQNWNTGTASFRQIAIDGKVPFREFLEYRFDYNRDWYTEVLSDPAGNPYELYLPQGKHTLSFMVVFSENLVQAMESIAVANEKLSALYRKILLITSAEPDSNYDYDLDKSIPDLLASLKELELLLETAGENILKDSGKPPSSVSNLRMIGKKLAEMRADPDLIPKRLTDITNSMTTFGNLIQSLQNSPLGVDEITLYPASDAVYMRKTGFLEKLRAMLQGFVQSFREDYSNVSYAAEYDRTLKVWLSRGTEWAAPMTRLIENEFEPEYGIGVSLNILPSGSLSSSVNPLLLAITSGNGPDAVIGMEANYAVEYGVRGIAMDISDFPDYQTVNSRFHEKIANAATFQNKVYGLPETMDFNLMVYRKDILSELRLAVPNTWQEVYYQTLPTLYQNNMQMESASFDTYLYQMGGQYYTEDGLFTALDSEASYDAFEQYIAQFLELDFPISLNFFNRFRTGETPVGFINYATYLSILTAAPELTGKWELALVPGIVQEDGSIRRTSTALASTADIILKGPGNSNDAWTFLKWWSSDKVQTSYGRLLENVLGSGARWNPANLEAFRALPWNKNHIGVICEYWNNVDVIPHVLGSVITTRALNNAANYALYSGYTPREALETAILAISTELERKQAMYGITAKK